MTNQGSTGGSPVSSRAEGKWIGFKIVDNETGDPMGNVRITAGFSNGAYRSGHTLQNGEVRFNNIPAGQCLLEECAKGRILMEKAGDYTLQDQDTLLTIAETEQSNGNDILWEDIAAFNWGEECRDVKIAAEHMRDELGCTDYNGTQKHMVYKTGSTSHTIAIPKKIHRTDLSTNTIHEIKAGPKVTPPQFLSCCGIPNITFAHSDSFIRPNAENYLKTLKEQVAEHPDARLMIFGHTDKTGSEDFNKRLSVRRAKSAFSLLTKNPDYWVTLYSSGKTPDNEDWGVQSVQIILNYLNSDARLDISNTLDDRTVREIETIATPAWENTGNGKAIPDSTLKKIFQVYMDTLMEGADIKEGDFVPLKHTGCSEFNPIIDIDRAEEDNRRVTFFLFGKDRLPKLPCSNTDISPCNQQSSQYRINTSVYRNHKSFACAFYDSLARDCADEVVLPDIIAFDAHMHFMSGHCTPMPLLWNQLPTKPKVQRSTLDFAGKYILRFVPTQRGTSQGAVMQQKTTLQIADIGFAFNQEVYEKIHLNYKAKKQKLYTPMMAMSMDMSYAHIDGYDGHPIYHQVKEKPYCLIYEYLPDQEMTVPVQYTLWPDDLCPNKDIPLSVTNAKKLFGKKEVENTLDYKTYQSKNGNEGFYFYYERFSVLDENQVNEISKKGNKVPSGNDRIPVWLPEQEMDLFVDWPAQKEETIAIAVKYPLQYMAMYHYDPRRWSKLDNAGKSKSKYHEEPESWDEPFKEIATEKQTGTFVGFKMYTALGYQPFDKRLENTLTEYYRKCQELDIPIMCHCSPSGMWSHDRELYFYKEGTAYTSDYDYMYKKWYRRKQYYDTKRETGFYDKFVRPTAWESQVLSRFPDLRLCLAHFGGGSSDWTTWLKDTDRKIAKYKRIKREQERNSNIRLTQDEKDVLIASWYNRFETDKTKRTFKGSEELPGWYYEHFGKEEAKANKEENKGNPSPQTWIKDFVEIMGQGNGQKYKNFITDISFHFIKDHHKQFTWLIREFPFLKEKIMFGTDWYMTELDKFTNKAFIRDAYPAINKISLVLNEKTGVYEDLWSKFARTNPMKFYKIRSIADNYAKGLEEANVKYEEEFEQKYDNLELISSIMNNNLDLIRRSDLV